MPYSSSPEDSAPSTKYFIAASVESAESRLSATNAYRQSDISSRPRNSVRKLAALQAAVGEVPARVDERRRHRDVAHQLEQVAHQVGDEQAAEDDPARAFRLVEDVDGQHEAHRE